MKVDKAMLLFEWLSGWIKLYVSFSVNSVRAVKVLEVRTQIPVPNLRTPIRADFVETR